MQIIGLMGFAGAGKSTTAELIAKYVASTQYGVPCIRSFAGPLKQAAAMMGAGKTVEPVVYRRVCQTVGSMLRDPCTVPGKTGEDWWVNQMKAEIKSILGDENLNEGTERMIIIDDVRYQNEVNFIRENGGKLIFCDASKRGIDGKGDIYQHESERLARQYVEGTLPDEYVDLVLPTDNMDYTDHLITSGVGRWATGGVAEVPNFS